MNQIPISRLILYAFILGLLPIVGALWYFQSQSKAIANLTETLQLTREMALLHEEKQKFNLGVIENFKKADRFFIDKQVEPIRLLEPEIDALQKIAKQNNFVENENVKARLDLLQNTNSLKFAEGVVQSYPLFTETTETLVQPVQVNLDDLESILSKIEGVPFGTIEPPTNRPQLIITDFKIEKKNIDKDNEVYFLNIKILKREFNS